MVKVAWFQEELVGKNERERRKQIQAKADFLAQISRDRVISITNITLQHSGRTHANVTYVYYE
ncbi:hypothetical protein C6P08_05415 [Weissella confusa]|uniref:hypothetical protein n=1 Tax=Weissella confusa TaxID=1583 RepID=UPI0010930162|nr:hypothetical protein [Weissella confusa]MBJ7695099.1 hypothetical protein [Weissella confusa]QBZ04644.1 hypothetical protein C6P08_05415 [Weissella confusa]